MVTVLGYSENWDRKDKLIGSMTSLDELQKKVPGLDLSLEYTKPNQ